MGIPVLDSGIEKPHTSMLAADGKTLRVKAAVDLQTVDDATAVDVKDWAAASTPPPAWSRQCNDGDLEWKMNGIGNDHRTSTVMAPCRVDAAGRGFYRPPTRPASRPGAGLYKVKVLDANGYGRMSDVIAGIDRMI